MVIKQAMTIVVGLGEIKIAKDPSAVLTCLGLGSCIGICAYDPIAKVAGMAHIVLPCSNGRSGPPSPKYADIGIPYLLEQVKQQGGITSRLIIKIAGGAQISKAPGLEDSFKIGQKNAAAVNDIFGQIGISIKAADVGGDYGRTLKMFLETGNTIVSSAKLGPKEL
ncbi:MAG: chemotaxis protein CheD [Chloroflexi bacterium]|nr:chemotaxis protein CheD [Chloroflexota bacterium]MDA1219543.1 chemotaxis protein CheD [Chloroflexota bacterium]